VVEKIDDQTLDVGTIVILFFLACLAENHKNLFFF